MGGGGRDRGAGRGEYRPARESGKGTEGAAGEAGSALVDRDGGTDMQSPQGSARVERAPAQPHEEKRQVDEGAYRELGGREKWEQFLSRVREARLPLGIWIFSAEVKGVRGDRLMLGFDPQHKFAMEMVLEEKNKRFIEGHLEKFFGRKLIIETAGPESAKSAAPKPRRPQGVERSEKFAGDDAVLEEIVKEFDGEVFSREQDRSGG